jgi:hypothetical protein
MMKVFAASLLVVLTTAGSVWAQNETPNVPRGLTGLWRFQNSANKLSATIGRDLVNSNPDNAGWMLGPWTMLGIPGNAGLYSDGGIIQDRSWDYLSCYHGISGPNGGGNYINQYSIAIDYHGDAGWNSLYQTAWNGNANDGDLWIDAQTRTAAKIGVGDVGYSTMTFDASPGKWHRIVLSVSNGNFFRAYVDGTLFLDGAGQEIDGRFSLELDRFNLFADDSWEDAWCLVGTVAVWGRALTSEEVAGMGGWGKSGPYADPNVPTELIATVPGDFNHDGRVDQADLDIWKTNAGVMADAILEMGDATGDGAVNLLDLDVWKAAAAVSGGGSAAGIPEPGTLAMLVAGLLGLVGYRWRRRRA